VTRLLVAFAILTQACAFGVGTDESCDGKRAVTIEARDCVTVYGIVYGSSRTGQRTDCTQPTELTCSAGQNKSHFESIKIYVSVDSLVLHSCTCDAEILEEFSDDRFSDR
jgi:hypothetical protein